MPVEDRSGPKGASFRIVLVAPTIEEVGKTSGPMTMKNGNRIVVDYWSDVSTVHAEQTRFREAVPSLAINASSALILDRQPWLVVARGGAPS